MDKIWHSLRFGAGSSVTYASGMALLLTIISVYCIAATGLLMGVAVSAFVVPGSFVLSTGLIATQFSKRCCLWATVVNVVAWVAAIVLSWHIYDFSVDGIEYHQTTIYALADGWNPFWNEEYKNWLSLWSKHYACGLELISACIFKMTGEIESGKAVNFLLGLAAFLICLDVVKRLRPGISKSIAVLFALMAVCNPVWLSQAPTFYIDFAMYFYLLMTIVFSIDIADGVNGNLSRLGFAGMILLAIATKFNHFFMEGVAVLAILGWLMISGKKTVAWSLFKLSALSAVIGAVVLAFHPYVTNWMTQGNPFYPLMGQGAMDIMTYNTPDLYKGHGRLINFVLSIYGPLSLPAYDSRISGFGPLFRFLFTVCLVFIFLSEIKKKKISLTGYMALCVLGSCFFFEQSWWARYNPQIWMIVPLALYDISGWKKSIGRVCGLWIVGILATINVALSLVFPIIEGLRLTAYRNTVFEVFSGRHVRACVGDMWEERLSDHGLVPEVVDENAIPEENRITLLYIPEEGPIRYNWLEADADDRAKIDSLYISHPVCVFRNNLVEYVEPAYRSIKSKLGWKSSD